MLIQERLQLILKMHNLTPSAFADQIGVQRSNVSHVISGRNKPSLDFLEKIISTFPRVNAHWLITGVMSKEGGGQEENNVDFKAERKDGVSAIESSAKLPSGIVKIVEFYDDETFKVYYPSSL
jgi:transcriptional regulator with XRE-family HTH domain